MVFYTNYSILPLIPPLSFIFFISRIILIQPAVGFYLDGSAGERRNGAASCEINGVIICRHLSAEVYELMVQFSSSYFDINYHVCASAKKNGQFKLRLSDNDLSAFEDDIDNDAM